MDSEGQSLLLRPEKAPNEGCINGLMHMVQALVSEKTDTRLFLFTLVNMFINLNSRVRTYSDCGLNLWSWSGIGRIARGASQTWGCLCMFVLTVLVRSDLCGVSVSSVHIEVRVEVCYIALMSSQLHIP